MNKVSKMNALTMLKKINNRNARLGNKTFEVKSDSKKGYQMLCGLVIFGENKFEIIESKPKEFTLILKTQKMLKY